MQTPSWHCDEVEWTERKCLGYSLRRYNKPLYWNTVFECKCAFRRLLA